MDVMDSEAVLGCRKGIRLAWPLEDIDTHSSTWHTLTSIQKWSSSPFCMRRFEINFYVWNRCILTEIRIQLLYLDQNVSLGCSQMSIYQYANIGWDKILVRNRWEAINWISAGLVYSRIYASPGRGKLNISWKRYPAIFFFFNKRFFGPIETQARHLLINEVY